MKSLNISELYTVAEGLQPMVGAHLQKIICHKNLLCLGMWSELHHQLTWIIFVDHNTQPNLMVLESLPKSLKAETRPIGLFINKNLLKAELLSIGVLKGFGRVLELNFSAQGKIQIRLFPHGQNFIVESGKKKISLHKPQELKALEAEDVRSDSRSMLELLTQMKEYFGKNQEKSLVKVGTAKEQKIKKINSAIAKLTKDIAEKTNMQWKQAAEELQTIQSLKISTQLQKYLNSELTLIENIENCFSQAKKNREKLERSHIRLEELQNQLIQIESGKIKVQENNQNLSHQKKQFSKLDIKCRTRPLSDGKMAYLGKSAKDNLSLLRSAKSWHLWMHIKDMPGAHLIIHRNKNQVVSDKELRELAQWVLGESYKKDLRSGDRFEFYVAEVRHVKPIKGDRHGRVNYRNERVIPVQIA